MSFKLTIGRVGFAAVDLFPNEAIVEISPIKGAGVSKEFLYVYLGSRDLTEGSAQAAKGMTLNRKSLEAIEIGMPPPPPSATADRQSHRVHRYLHRSTGAAPRNRAGSASNSAQRLTSTA